MSQFKDVAVGSTVYFWFALNTTAGAAGDGATPLYDVRLAGAASSAIPTASGTPTLLTHADYTDGLHEIAINTTGYTAGSEYAVFCTATISSVNPAGFVGSFVVRAAASTLYEVATGTKTKTDQMSFASGRVAANIQMIAGFADAATRLSNVARSYIYGNVGTGSTIYTIVIGSCDPAPVTDQYKGRMLTFNTDTTTANLRGQSKFISGNSSASFSVDTLSDVPVSGDTFSIEGTAGRLNITSAQTVTTTTNLTNGVIVSTNLDKTGYEITSNIKQNQALSNFSFLMIDSTTNLPATGKTVTVTRVIDGGVYEAGTLSAVTEVSHGGYRTDFAAADLNGKVITLKAAADGCYTTYERIVTQA